MLGPMKPLVLLIAALFVAGCPGNKSSPPSTPSAEPGNKSGSTDKPASGDKSGAPKEDDEGGW
jgi:hypothetical protein